MKRAIKTVTFTIDELRKMLEITLETGTTSEADRVISDKVTEKSQRLARQRERRRLRKEQQRAATSEKSEQSVQPESTESTETSDRSENVPTSVTIELNRKLASCILWLRNRNIHLENNILAILSEIARHTNHPSIKSIAKAINQLLRIVARLAVPAHDYLHNSCHSRRPANISIML